MPMSPRVIKAELAGEISLAAPLAAVLTGGTAGAAERFSPPELTRGTFTALAAASAEIRLEPAEAAPAMRGAVAESVTAAQGEAERIIANARGAAADIERAARERGLAEGRTLAAAEVAREVEPLYRQLAETLAEINELRPQLAMQAEQELIALAVEIAKKVVHREVAVDREVCVTLARVALARLHARAVAAVHLHPEDYAHLSAHRERLEMGASIELVEDRTVGRGGCLVRTEMGDVDARIEQQFAEIERGFMGL